MKINTCYKIMLAIALSISISACSDKPAEKPVAQVKKAPVKTPEELSKEALASVHATMAKKHPDVAFDQELSRQVQVGSSTFFELVTPTAVLYTNSNVDFILFGNLFVGEGDKVTDITASAAKPKQQEPTVHPQDIFDSLPFDKGLSKQYGDAVRKMAVFEDPDCAFCQAFRADLEAAAPELNLSVTFFPMVMSETHPNALERAKALSCAKEPGKAWDMWMKDAAGKNPDELWPTWSKKNLGNDGSCPAGEVVTAWQEVVAELGFVGTPTLMFEDGTTLEGRPSKEDLKKYLDSTYAAAKLRHEQLALAEQAAAAAVAQAQQPAPVQEEAPKK